MKMVDNLKEMFRHMYWADATVWMTVLATENADKSKKLKTQLFQIHTVQYAFGQVWMKKPLDIPKIDRFENLTEMAGWASKYAEFLDLFIDGVVEEDLDMTMELPWADRMEKVLGKKPCSTTLADTMIQIPSHSSHHRGQVCTSIRETGGEPPLVDFIAWAWFGKPEAEWP